MRKYYEPTIEKTLHSSRRALEKMIACCVGNRKNPVGCSSNIENSNQKKIFWRAELLEKKILARRASI